MTVVVVSGALANRHLNGGGTWVRLNWVLGLKKLGFDVYFVEQIERATCVDAAGQVTSFEQCENLAYFRRITEQFGLAGSAALVYDAGDQVHGMTWAELLDVAASADLLVNISGHLRLTPVVHRVRRRVYLDLDPGFTQLWHAAGTVGAGLAGHDFYFTVGENVGTAASSLPSGELRWRRIRPPVLLEQWPVSGHGDRNRFTTVASWRGPYGPVHYGGKTFGLKVHEFRKFVQLPGCVPQRLEIALHIDPADEPDRQRLLGHGWQVVDPQVVAPDPLAFRHYVQTSGGEFSVAKGIYVEANTGWLSDRTVGYLASGKPALVQDTGFGHHYPMGEGLVPFRRIEDARAGAARIAADYERHCRAARALAEAYFDSDRVLGHFVEQVGAAP
jgi:hypothetical protein